MKGFCCSDNHPEHHKSVLHHFERFLYFPWLVFSSSDQRSAASVPTRKTFGANIMTGFRAVWIQIPALLLTTLNCSKVLHFWGLWVFFFLILLTTWGAGKLGGICQLMVCESGLLLCGVLLWNKSENV